jgi:hypothetical protein
MFRTRMYEVFIKAKRVTKIVTNTRGFIVDHASTQYLIDELFERDIAWLESKDYLRKVVVSDDYVLYYDDDYSEGIDHEIE